MEVKNFSKLILHFQGSCDALGRGAVQQPGGVRTRALSPAAGLTQNMRKWPRRVWGGTAQSVAPQRVEATTQSGLALESAREPDEAPHGGHLSSFIRVNKTVTESRIPG